MISNITWCNFYFSIMSEKFYFIRYKTLNRAFHHYFINISSSNKNFHRFLSHQMIFSSLTKSWRQYVWDWDIKGFTYKTVSFDHGFLLLDWSWAGTHWTATVDINSWYKWECKTSDIKSNTSVALICMRTLAQWLQSNVAEP